MLILHETRLDETNASVSVLHLIERHLNGFSTLEDIQLGFEAFCVTSKFTPVLTFLLFSSDG